MTTDIENRQIRIFISSTFRDMMAERDYLVTKVFPALRRYCEERDVSLFELDLRWGISEEESKQGKVVDICLKEIRKTTPFFIGLLGQRYGWIPSEAERGVIAANSDVFEEYPWLEAELAEGTSITEIEIQEGVLRAKDRINAYFYFRSPVMEVPELFKEQPGTHEAGMLSELKKILREQDAHPVKDYDSAEHLGRLVEADFKALVDRLFPRGALSPLEKDRLEQKVFVKGRTAVYVPGPGWFEALDAFVDKPGSADSAADRALVVSGERGMGKSALLANWLRRRGERPGETVIYHFVGARAGDYRGILERLTAELRDRFALPAGEAALPEQEAGGPGALTRTLQTLLFAAAKAGTGRGKLVIVLEGVEELSAADNAKALGWFPAFPENVRLILSSPPGDETMEALKRREYPVLTLGPLPLESRKQLITGYLASFGKGLLPSRVLRIAADRKSENPLALRTMLDELRVFGVHERIDERIDHYLAAPDMESLFALALERLEEIFGQTLVKDVCALIAVSRAGLGEAELLALTGTAPLYWSQLYHAAAGHLSERNGLVTFGHSFMRGAVYLRYLAEEGAEQEYRRRIAAWFETAQDVPAGRVRDEVPRQLEALGEWDRLHAFLLDLEVFEYIYQKDKYELGRYWRSLSEQREMGEQGGQPYALTDYLARYGLEPEGSMSAETLSRAYDRLGYLAAIVLSDYPAALEYGKAAVALKEQTFGPEHPALADTLLTAAMVCGILKDKEQTREYRRRALEIREAACGKEHPDTAKALYYYAMTFNAGTALEYSLEALAVQEKTLGRHHPDTAWTLANIGRIYFAIEQYGKALEYEEEALRIRESLFGSSHSDTVDSYTNISAAYLACEDHRKALEYAQKSLLAVTALYGKVHYWTARSHEAVGTVYSLMHQNDKDFGKAFEHLQAAIAVWDILFEGIRYGEKTGNPAGTMSAEKAELLNLIGILHDNAGNTEKAREHLSAAWEMFKIVRGENHPATLDALANLESLSESTKEDIKA